MFYERQKDQTRKKKKEITEVLSVKKKKSIRKQIRQTHSLCEGQTKNLNLEKAVVKAFFKHDCLPYAK